MAIQWNAKRDLIAGGVGLMFGGLGGLAGVAAKKFLIDKNDSFGKRFAVGLATTVLTLGTGTIPFLIATPGKDAQADMMGARQNIAAQRYASVTVQQDVGQGPGINTGIPFGQGRYNATWQ